MCANWCLDPMLGPIYPTAVFKVLLKNEGGMLPLSPKAKVAFLGPHANSTLALLGNYHGDNHFVYAHSALMEAKARGLDVVYERGCQICDFPYGTSPGCKDPALPFAATGPQPCRTCPD